MPTLIFTPRYSEDSQLLWKAASQQGWHTERLTGWRVPDHLQGRSDAVFYGEALFGPMLAEQLGLDLLQPPEDWLVPLPHEYRLRDIALSTLAEARRLTARAFIKPPNDKSFPAAVYEGAGQPEGYDDAMPVLVAEVVQWQAEFRCFVLDRQVKAYSLYSRLGELQREQGFASTPDEQAQMLAFAQTLLADPRVDLPRATVVDIGLIAGRGWACVEQNAAWGAGIYGCDPQSVLNVLQHAAVPVSHATGT
ncbi:protein of unknown function [Andreprevotia lacus DSM 23236]|jgi:hypothetical protein|uniref:ATP-grasp domain-containing protein n=1 Tax=Andreprevotia lacus DSM 23236 TaxID=1121001 RepID=A0A1W1WXQ2_9NEIS|nr:ATP-grasp domain-containing protein [Andreprevotia lacus]SMC16424.1 protein of unknown function [Andreprevotia lacus DSM 23236]